MAQPRAAGDDALRLAAQDARRHRRSRSTAAISAAASEIALGMIDYAGFPERQRRARAEGRYLGIGIGNGVKGTGRGPFESGIVRIGRSGRISVYTGAMPMGQGIRTALAQICAEQFDVAPDSVTRHRRRYRRHSVRPGRLRQPPDRHGGLGGASRGGRGARQGAAGGGASPGGEPGRSRDPRRAGRDRRRARQRAGAARDRRGGVRRAGLFHAGKVRARASRACRASCRTR